MSKILQELLAPAIKTAIDEYNTSVKGVSFTDPSQIDALQTSFIQGLSKAIATSIHTYLTNNVTVPPNIPVTTSGNANSQTGGTTTSVNLIAL